MNGNNTDVQTTGQDTVDVKDTAPDITPKADNKPDADSDLEKRIEKLVQSKADRLNAESGKTIAALKKEIEALKKASMTADEVKDYEISEKEKTIAEREAQLLEKENRLTAISALKEVGLDNGTPESAKLIDFIMGKDEKEIKSKAHALKSCFDKYIQDNLYSGKRTIPQNGGGSPQPDEFPGMALVKKIGEDENARRERSNKIFEKYVNRKF